MADLKKSFPTDPAKGTVCLAAGGVFLVTGIALAASAHWIGAVIFLLVSLPYLFMGLWNFTVIVLSDQGVSRCFLGKTLKHFSWDEIREVGVTGTRVFNRRKKEKTGRIYLYFSPRILTEDDRFEMALRWPAFDKPYTLYDPEKVRELRQYWTGPIAEHNTGDLSI